MASETLPRFSLEKYLELEREAEFRSEYIDGQIVSMAGCTWQHEMLQGNIYFELRGRLRGTGCRAVLPGFRIQVSRQHSTYPDVAVVCGKLALADGQNDAYTNPAVVVEVLSPNTEHYDRGEKFRRYRMLESVKDYILIDQRRVLVEHFTRQPDNSWTLRDCQKLDEELSIDTIGVKIPLQCIYEGVELASE